MRASTAYFAGAGTVIAAIAAGVGGGLLIADMVSPKTPKTELSRLERRMSPEPIQRRPVLRNPCNISLRPSCLQPAQPLPPLRRNLRRRRKPAIPEPLARNRPTRRQRRSPQFRQLRSPPPRIYTSRCSLSAARGARANRRGRKGARRGGEAG